jgi:hypothetical protein
MALTLKAEQQLERIGLVDFFTERREQWKRLAQRAYQFVATNFPEGARVRRDDVAEALTPLIEVDEQLNNFLAEKRQKQKYWIAYFCDLIIDQTWEEITQAPGPP